MVEITLNHGVPFFLPGKMFSNISPKARGIIQAAFVFLPILFQVFDLIGEIHERNLYRKDVFCQLLTFF